MEKKELISEVAEKTKISEEEVTKILDEFTSAIKEGLIKGEELLTKQPKGVLNSNVLKWYLENPDRIPKEWEKYSGIYFWGTILRYPFGCRRVLCLDFDGGEWDWDYNWLVGDWDRGNPSASLASAKNLPGKTKGSVPPPPRLFARGEFYT